MTVDVDGVVVDLEQSEMKRVAPTAVGRRLESEGYPAQRAAPCIQARRRVAGGGGGTTAAGEGGSHHGCVNETSGVCIAGNQQSRIYLMVRGSFRNSKILAQLKVEK